MTRQPRQGVRPSPTTSSPACAARLASRHGPTPRRSFTRRPVKCVDRPRQPRRLGRHQSFITGALPGVAVDGAHIYWTTASHDRPRQPRRHGRRPELHPGATTPGVAVDAAHVYWTNSCSEHDRARQPRRHGASNQSFISGDAAPRWGRGRRRARLLGERAPTRSAAPTSTAPGVEPELHHRRDQPYGVWRSTRATSTGRTTSAGTIGRANLNGSGVDQSFIEPTSVRESWRSTPSTSTGPIPAPRQDSIGRANLDGSGVQESCITCIRLG